MPPDDLVYPEIETVTPEEAARLRARGITLPQMSEAAADPRQHSDFVDQRLRAVGFGITIGGYHLYVTEVALPLLLPDSLVDLSGRPALAISSAIYPSLDAARDAVRNAQPLASGTPSGTVRFAYFRSYGGVIMPTVFSDVSAPRTIGTARAAMAELGRTVSEELIAQALTIAGARLIGSVYTRIVGALNRWGRGPVRSQLEGALEREAAIQSRSSSGSTSNTNRVQGPDAITPPSGAVGASTEAAARLGRRIGEAVKGLTGGKRAAIAQRVSAAQLSPADAAVATGEASIAAFGRIGSTVRLPNGDLVVPSVMVGPNQPVFVVRPNGSVVPARATISVTQPLNINQPITISNVVVEPIQASTPTPRRREMSTYWRVPPAADMPQGTG